MAETSESNTSSNEKRPRWARILEMRELFLVLIIVIGAVVMSLVTPTFLRMANE